MIQLQKACMGSILPASHRGLLFFLKKEVNQMEYGMNLKKEVNQRQTDFSHKNFFSEVKACIFMIVLFIISLLLVYQSAAAYRV